MIKFLTAIIIIINIIKSIIIIIFISIRIIIFIIIFIIIIIIINDNNNYYYPCLWIHTLDLHFDPTFVKLVKIDGRAKSTLWALQSVEMFKHEETCNHAQAQLHEKCTVGMHIDTVNT